MTPNPSRLPEDLYAGVVEKMETAFGMTHDEAVACQSACSSWLRSDGADLCQKAIDLKEPDMVVTSFIAGWLAQKTRIHRNQ